MHGPAGTPSGASGVLAHAAGHTARQNIVETLCLVASVGLVAAAVRARNLRLAGHPAACWALGLAAVAALVLAFVIPSQLGVKVAAVRPSTSATIAILSPKPRQVFRGDPAVIRVRLRVTGARIVTQTSAHLSPRQGHIHLYLDGELAAMTYTTSTTIDVTPGVHKLKAEFVATDHGPFNPPVTVSVQFQVRP